MTSEDAAEAGHAGAESAVLIAQFAMHDAGGEKVSGTNGTATCVA